MQSLQLVNQPWFLGLMGTVLCAGGCYKLYQNIFEDDRPIKAAILIIVMGVLLLTLAMAKFYNLVK